VANIYKNEMFDLANTGANLVYTTPSDSRAIVKTVQITNSGANTLVTLSANNLTSSFDTSIQEITSNTHANLIDGPLILQESQTLSITANVANTVSGVISLLEINRNEQ
tara:strand:- start:3232 stop:3558 length:327 start_codon:yes stop_codon:yes gene_type:complete